VTNITTLTFEWAAGHATGWSADEQATARIKFGSYELSAPGPSGTAFNSGQGRWVFAISLARW
jgi:hypothetical protein